MLATRRRRFSRLQRIFRGEPPREERSKRSRASEGNRGAAPRRSAGYANLASLFESVRNPAAGQIVWRHLYAHAIADQDANPMLAHLARDRSEHHVIAVIKSHFEKCIGLLIYDCALRWY